MPYLLPPRATRKPGQDSAAVSIPLTQDLFINFAFLNQYYDIGDIIRIYFTFYFNPDTVKGPNAPAPANQNLQIETFRRDPVSPCPGL